MGFKLLRVDVNDTCKIQLEVGKHLIGRGKFLHCDDKRVSRSHGELEVTENSVNLKSLHTNPCFYVRKGTDTRGMIKQNESIDLRNGDKFGLLPVDCWYEVLYTTNDDEEIGQKPVKQESQIQNGRINETNKAMFDSTEVDNDFAERMDHMDSTLMLGPQSSNENVLPPPQTDNDPPLSPIYESDMSQSLIQDLQLPEPREDVASDKVPSIGDAVNPEDLLQNPSVENPPVSVKAEPVDRDSVVHQSPLKRSPSSDANQGPSEVKKIKTDPDDVAGTSNGCDAQKPVAQAGPAAPGAPPPAPHNPRPRERCMYGANCYRKNPIHKQEFSHPSDSDWGSGPLGACPYGARCVRRDPRHWAQHQHPPGTLPPPQRPPPGNKKRPKKKRQSTDSEDSDQDAADSPDVILTGKRARKKVNVQKWSDSDSNEDPFQTDDEDDWRPSGSLDTDFDSQIDTQDD